MVRNTSLVIFPMLLLTILLLTYQWSMYVYGDQSENNISETPDVYIEVNHSKDKLIVTQTIKNLSEGSYSYTIPSHAKNIQCELEEGESCLIQDQKVIVDQNKQLLWTYNIEYDPNTLVFPDLFLTLKQNNEPVMSDMNIEVIERNKPFSNWMVPANLEAEIQKDYIRYYRWTKPQTNAVPLLHLQEETYQLNQKEDLYIYTRKSIGNELDGLLDAWKDTSLNGAFVVIVNEELPKTSGDGYMILPRFDEDAIKKSWLSQALKSTHQVENRWLVSVLTDYFINETGQGPKSNQIIKTLDKQLSVNEKEQFRKEIFKSDASTFSEGLDHALHQVVGKPTRFFNQNQNQGDPFIPLYFLENKTLKVSGEEVQVSWQPIMHQHERYYSLAGIARLFDFELVALPSESIYILRKNGESWRFSLNEKTFVHNEEDFGVVTDVLKEIEEEVFIKERYIEELLGIQISEGAYSINMHF